jgi:anti-sigma-K factor RskA
VSEANRGKDEIMAGLECPLMHGEDNADVLLDYANRKLAPEMAAIFEQHVEVCAACQEFIAAQREVWSALDAFESMPVSPDFDDRLWARIEQEESRPWWAKAWSWMTAGGTAMWRPLAPVAAGLVLAVGLYLAPADREPVGEPLAKAVERLDAEQVETTLEDLEMLRQLAVTEAGGAKSI